MDVNVSLDVGLTKFVESEVSAGRYPSPGDVMRAALRFMEAATREEAGGLRRLQDAWQDGIDSDDAGELDLAALKEEARRRSVASPA